MIILTTINEILSPVNLLVLAGFLLPLMIYLFMTKYRGIWASLFFLPVLYYAATFVLGLEQLSQIATNDYVINIMEGFGILMTPFNTILHVMIMDLLSLIAPGVEIVETILAAPWFPLALYAIVWILFLLIFKKKRRRKKQRRYEDDF